MVAANHIHHGSYRLQTPNLMAVPNISPGSFARHLRGLTEQGSLPKAHGGLPGGNLFRVSLAFSLFLFFCVCVCVSLSLSMYIRVDVYVSV